MKIGGTRIYGMGVLIAGILTLFTPVAARSSVWALVALRVAEGLALVSFNWLKCYHSLELYYTCKECF